MQLVGATKRFIRRPFIRKSMQLGLIAALIAIAGLAAFAYYIDSKIPELALFSDLKPYGFLALGMLLLGLLITWISTFFATRRFLNLRTDELYY
jgi:cell division transport system permease protein